MSKINNGASGSFIRGKINELRVIEHPAGENLLTGDWVYVKSDGNLWKTDASAEATSGPVPIGIMTAGVLTGVTGIAQVGGLYTTTGLTPGPYYVSETAGAATPTPPATIGATRRVAAYALNATTWMILPSTTYTVNGASLLVANEQTGLTYTLALTDVGRERVLEMNTVDPSVVTVPTFASVAAPVGSIFQMGQTGEGQATVRGAVGVTINGVTENGTGNSDVDFQGRWGYVTLYNVAVNTWRAIGGLDATPVVYLTADDINTLAELNAIITDATLIDTGDSRLSNARTPTAHASSHASAGGDPLKLDDLAAPDDNTDLDVSTTAHGLVPKAPNDAGKFLRGDGTWATLNNDGTVTLGWASSNETSDLAISSDVFATYLPYDIEITKVYISVTTAPVGSDLTVTLLDNGTSIFAAGGDMTVIAGNNTSEVLNSFNGGLPTHFMSKGDKLSVDITGVGATTPGAGLKVFVTGYVNSAGHREVIQVPLTAPGGTLTAATKFYFDYPYAGTVTKFEVKAQVAPTVTAPSFDLSKAAAWGGTPVTQLNAALTITVAAFAASTSSFAAATVTAGSVGEVEITGVDSGATCADAIALIHYIRD